VGIRSEWPSLRGAHADHRYDRRCVESDSDTSGRLDSSALVSSVRVLRERWWVVAAAVAACVAISLALSLSATKEYEATSRILVGQATTDITALINSNAVPTLDPQRQQGTALELVTSTAVAERVVRALDLREDPGAVADRIVATAEADTDLVSITASDASPQRAADLANAFAEQYRDGRTAADRQRLAQAEELLERQIAELPTTEVAQRRQLELALQQVTALRVVSTGNAEVVDRARVPTSASSPRPSRDAILGILFGLALGIGGVFLVDLFDRRLKSVDDFEGVYGMRTLTSIPEQSRDPSSQRDQQAALEPFRILRGALGLVGGGRDVVLVTSAVAGEGKSTVAAGLARAIALSGQRCALVEVDLRRPTFHQQFDLGGDNRGLTTALVGGTPVGELLRPVVPGLPTFFVLPSGPLPPNSAEILRSPEMGVLLRALSEEVDVVVLDAPPLLPVADAQVLLDHPQVDTCIVVGRAYRTSRDEARRARAVVERHRVRSTGLVVNGVRDLDGGYAYYGAAEKTGANRLSRA
jgi:succinoglycan biosynthesis transport protein ExoP